MRRVIVLASAAAALTAAWIAHSAELTLSIADLESPGLSARGVRARLAGKGWRELALSVDRLTAAGREWRNVKLTCADFAAARGRLACTKGVLDAGGRIPISFSYVTATRDFTLEAKFERGETWHAAGTLKGADTTIDAKVENASLGRFAAFLPKDAPKLTAGRATGTLQLRGSRAKGRVTLDGVGFADASGLHAGEKIAAALDLDASRRNDAWTWTATVEWRAGDVFWTPFFVSGSGQRLALAGATAAGRTEVRSGTLDLPGIGQVKLDARWDHTRGALVEAHASGARLKAGAIYDRILKPLLEGTALSDLRAEGEITASVAISGGEVRAVDAELFGVSFEDKRERRFGVFGVSGRVPWRRGEQSTVEVTVKGAEVFKLPIGAMRIPLRVRTNSIVIAAVRVPLLDGALELRDFVAGTTPEGWRWRFAGELQPISMDRLSQALQLPTMYGTLAGSIPEVRYRRHALSMDGTLKIEAFDGDIAVSRLELVEPFGRAPRLGADIEMKALDLELLTRTFDFGTITGRIDARVAGLELSSWQPVRFDATLSSSPGDYPRKISQRAVQNISALGGAGAAAAIQRSLLRFFDQFGYERLGLSCRLRNGVCEMDGIERAPQGYVIVKGGGIPAISVIGYNRAVNWRELVDRLKRITQDNVKPIVR
ncbi:MAG TPA: hypothetical protein VHP37_20685 [Burkholderiales bacterium]|nr:hypothetical protein [Burkholderiales bacterium]